MIDLESNVIAQETIKTLVPVFTISLIVIRFWIEVITTTILKKSKIVNKVNNNKIGFHHWQLGLVIVLAALLVMTILPSATRQLLIVLGFGLALLIDQYIFILSMIGVNLPFDYRSLTDYLVVGLIILCLCLLEIYLNLTII